MPHPGDSMPDVSRRLEDQGLALPTPSEDLPLVVVDLVPKAGCVGHGQLKLHAILLDDCGEEREAECGPGGGEGRGVMGDSLTVSHRMQLQRLGHGHPQTRHRGLPYLGLEECVHHGGLAQPALSCE